MFLAPARLQTHEPSEVKFCIWNDKFDRNIVRDIKTQHELSLLGYRVAIVWECSLRAEGVADAGNMGATLTLERLIDFIKSDDETIEL